jgi:hypothetical protein
MEMKAEGRIGISIESIIVSSRNHAKTMYGTYVDFCTLVHILEAHFKVACRGGSAARFLLLGCEVTGSRNDMAHEYEEYYTTKYLIEHAERNN